MILATWCAIFMYTQESGFEIWVVIKIMVPSEVLSIVQHLFLRVPKKGPEL